MKRSAKPADMRAGTGAGGSVGMFRQDDLAARSAPPDPIDVIDVIDAMR